MNAVEKQNSKKVRRERTESTKYDKSNTTA